jgi:NTE family protein
MCRMPASPRIGLALGAGGITAIAWMVGALDALREHTGWDPATADVISGTSAGAVVGTVLASGQDPVDLLRYAEDDAALAEQIRLATAGRRRDRRLPLPGSIGIGVKGLLASCPHQRLASLAGFLPAGQRSTDEIRGLTHEAARRGWPSRTELWLHACDYRSGARVSFGRSGAPEAKLADAVVASAAVPGYYRPVVIGGRTYVDGGLCSLSNLDAFAGAGCDVVICLSPFSSHERGPVVGSAVYGAFRGVTGLRLARETRALRDAGTEVVTIQPSALDLRAMGLNPMDRRRSRRVLATARETTAAQLERAPRVLAPALAA